MTKKTVTLPGGSSSAISSSFDALSRLSSLTTPVSKATYSYLAGANGNTTTLVSSVSYAKVNSNGFTPVTFGYTYDAVGNILTASQTGNGTTTYTYDQQGQLLSETTSGYGTRSCEYDTYGNIRFKVGSAYLTLDYDDSQWRDLLTSVTYYNGVDTPVTVDLTYDGSGNPLTYYNGKNYTMTWRNGRELDTLTTNGKTYSYEYDVNHLRTSKVVDGVTHSYIYAGGKLLREQYGTTTLDFLYDVNGSPYILQYTNGSSTATYYYITNLQGDVVRIVDTAGATVAQYRYDAWGTLLAITNSTGAHISSSTHIANINPLRYRGYYYDTETKFYYLQSRYYDPEIGRFINADGYASTGQDFLGYNMFAYCGNNPAVRIDVSGSAWNGTNTVAICDGGTPIYITKIENNPRCECEYSYLLPTSQDLYNYLYTYHMIPWESDGFSEAYLSVSRSGNYRYSQATSFGNVSSNVIQGIGTIDSISTILEFSLMPPDVNAALSLLGVAIDVIPEKYQPMSGLYPSYTVQSNRRYLIPESAGYTLRTERVTSIYLWVSYDQVWFRCTQKIDSTDIYIPATR